MNEKREYILNVITGTKRCPQCDAVIARGEEYPWWGKDFCSEECGKKWFRRHGG
ncbi:MAG: hypothetical protein ACE5F4_01735 [Candidatus Paceibacteria bacterium]